MPHRAAGLKPDFIPAGSKPSPVAPRARAWPHRASSAGLVLTRSGFLSMRGVRSTNLGITRSTALGYHGVTMPAPDEIIVPEPLGRTRALIAGLGAGWLALQIWIPATYYYRSDDPYDERFSWRMFSAVRVQHCSAHVAEQREGRWERLNLMETLPAPWISLLERSRPAVIDGFMDWRCDHGADGVRLTIQCTDANRQTLPPVEHERQCEGDTLADD